MGRMSIRILLLTAVLFCGLINDDAFGAWRSVKPESELRRVRLVPGVDAATGEPLSGIWTVLSPKDRFPVMLEGKGKIRIKTRPFFKDKDVTDKFRIAINLGAKQRRFLRRSQLDGLYEIHPYRNSGARVKSYLGEEDRLDLEWSMDKGSLVVINREADRSLLVRVLISEGVRVYSPNPSSGGNGKQLIQLDIEAPQAGWDSNPSLNPKNETDRIGGWFIPLDLGIDLGGRAGSRTDLKVSYDFDGNFYDNTVFNENRHRAHVEGKIQLGSTRPSKGADLLLEYRFTAKNDTFFGRGDRNEFETLDPDTGLPILLGNRFDYNEHMFSGGVSLNPGRSVKVSAAFCAALRDYLEDFNEYPDIYSLDQNRIGFDFEIDWRVSLNWTVTTEAGHELREYEQKFNRDESGNEIMDVPAQYRDTEIAGIISYGHGHGLHADGEFEFSVRRDQYAGYWDYKAVTAKFSLGWLWSGDHSLEGSLRYTEWDYDMARVGYDPSNALRQKSMLNLQLKGDLAVSAHWFINVNTRYNNADNNTESFAYERFMINGGMNYRR